MGRIVGLRVTVREGQLCGGGNGPSDPLRPPILVAGTAEGHQRVAARFFC
jgi:hypothetical protein